MRIEFESGLSTYRGIYQEAEDCDFFDITICRDAIRSYWLVKNGPLPLDLTLEFSSKSTRIPNTELRIDSWRINPEDIQVLINGAYINIYPDLYRFLNENFTKPRPVFVQLYIKDKLIHRRPPLI